MKLSTSNGAGRRQQRDMQLAPYRSIVFTKGLSSLVEFRITRHDLNMHKREFSERVQGGRECNHFD